MVNTQELVDWKEELSEAVIKKIKAILGQSEIIITWATRGIWRKVADLLIQMEISFIPVWSTKEERIKKLAENANPEKKFYSWDIFDPNSSAGKYMTNLTRYYTEEVNLVIIHCAAINPDHIPMFKDDINPLTWQLWEEWITSEKKGDIRKTTVQKGEYKNSAVDKDAIDPRTKKLWEVLISNEEKEEIRQEISDKQIKFFISMLEEMKKLDWWGIFINLGTILSKAWEQLNSVKKNSPYAHFKAEITQTLETTRFELEEKGWSVLDIYLWLVQTWMVNEKWDLALQRTIEFIKAVGKKVVLSWDKVQENMFSPEEVALFIVKAMSMLPNEFLHRIPLFLSGHRNIPDFLEKSEAIKEKILQEVISPTNELGITKEQIDGNENIKITPQIKDFLISLRQENLNNYCKKQVWGVILSTENNIKSAGEIIEGLVQQYEERGLSFNEFIDLCMRIEWNYL